MDSVFASGETQTDSTYQWVWISEFTDFVIVFTSYMSVSLCISINQIYLVSWSADLDSAMVL